jgi:hypothetical protein
MPPAPPFGQQSGYPQEWEGPDSEPALADLLDPRSNRDAMLSAGGGLAMAILGLRTIFGGRRRELGDAAG